MKSPYLTCIMAIMTGLCCLMSTPNPVGAERPRVTIGTVIDGPGLGNEALRQLFESEILELTQAEFDVRFPDDKFITSDGTAAGARDGLERLMADPEVDIIISNGAIASHVALSIDRSRKPVIAPFVIDPEAQGFTLEDGGSGAENLTYVTFTSSFPEDIKTFEEIAPFRRIAFVYGRHYLEAIPELVAHTLAEIGKTDVEMQVIPTVASADEVFAELSPDIQAVYVAALTMMPMEEFDRLIAGLIERKLPSFSYFGRLEVERGILAGSRPDMFPKVARRVALNVQRILLGEDPASIPVYFEMDERLTINMATARAIGLSPSWAVLSEAELLNEEIEGIQRELDLYTVAQEAVAANLDLAAQALSVSAGAQDVNEALANLLPQVNLSGLRLLIDEDRAEASFGQQAERTMSGGASATQVIFSEPALANLSIQRSLQRKRGADLEVLRLDIVQAATTSYLNVLKAKTFQRIQKENLKTTNENLQKARVRETIGTAGPAEVYRWESKIATDRQTVIEATAGRRIAEMELNRLLHRPLEELFAAKETGLEDPAMISNIGRLFKFVADPRSAATFREFLVEEGLVNSPELAGLDAAIAAQERNLRSKSLSFLLPSVAVSGEINRMFSEKGAGSDGGLDLGVPLELPEADDTNWSAALTLGFPVFQGGSRFAARKKALEELSRLRVQREAVAEAIEQRIRVSVHLASASYAGIRQARLAAEGADKSLDVVSDAYSRGAVSILDLLDAQNAALVANLAAANAAYDFLIDLMDLERAAGRFEFFASEEEREEVLDRVERYFEAARTRDN
jgi:outer membrane protein TolC/ABC-type uncharacterized transport system substrate-binding protein